MMKQCLRLIAGLKMSVVVIVLAKRVLSKDKVFSNLMVWDLIRLSLQNLMDR